MAENAIASDAQKPFPPPLGVCLRSAISIHAAPKQGTPAARTGQAIYACPDAMVRAKKIVSDEQTMGSKSMHPQILWLLLIRPPNASERATHGLSPVT